MYSFAQNLETLAQMIERGSDEQKRDALSQIRNLQTAEASRVAVPALKDSSEIVRATAAFSVVYLSRDEALSVLSPLLQDKSPLVRRETAYAIGRIGNGTAVNLLRQVVRRDKVSEVKNAAVVALGELGNVAAVADLTEILQRKPVSKDDFLRRSAARSVGQIAQIVRTVKVTVITPENFLPEKHKDVAAADHPNFSELFSVFQPSVRTLIQILKNPAEAGDTKREAAFALGAIGDESAINVLQLNLNAEDYYLAEICRESLLKISSPPPQN